MWITKKIDKNSFLILINKLNKLNKIIEHSPKSRLLYLK